jgi:hypothetical protein
VKFRDIITAGAFLIAFLLLGSQNLMAQRKAFNQENLSHYDQKPYHFGFSLGFNKMNFALKPVESLFDLNQETEFVTPYGPMNTVLPRADFGFHIGIVSNLKLSPTLDLRFVPTLAFGDRFIDYQYQRSGQNGQNGQQTGSVSQQFETTFIDLPLHLKYKSVRINNTRAYVLGGFKFSTDLSSNQYKDEGDEGIIYARSLKNDFHYELGFGFDHYFYYFKFSTEIKASFGMRNLIYPGESIPIFYNSIDRLNSKVIMVSFLFE